MNDENFPYLLKPYPDFPSKASHGILTIIVMGKYKFNRYPIFIDGKPIVAPVSIEKITNYLEKGGYPMTVIKVGNIKIGEHTIRIEGQTEYKFKVR